MEHNTVNQRLNLIVDNFEGGKKAAFARKVGMSPQGVQEILAGRKGDPSFKVLVKILESYPQVRIDWLVLGQGTMLHSGADADRGYSGHIGRFPVKSAFGNPEAAIIAGNKYNRLSHDYLRRDDSELPKKEEEDSFTLSDTSYAYESLALPASILKAGLHRAFPMQGSMMEPTFGDGDLIIATQIQRVDWNDFPRENDKYDVIDTFPMCVIEVMSEREKFIAFGRCCVDANLKTLRCFSDNRQFYPKAVDLADIKAVWKFNSFLSSRSLNPAQQLVYKVAKLEYELGEAKKSAGQYIMVKHRIRELILRWGTSMQMLGNDFDNYKDDEQLRKHYRAEVSQTDSEDEYALKLLSIIQALIIELTPTLEADFSKTEVPVRMRSVPSPPSDEAGAIQ